MNPNAIRSAVVFAFTALLTLACQADADVRVRFAGSNPGLGIVVGQFADGTGEWFVDLNNAAGGPMTCHGLLASSRDARAN